MFIYLHALIPTTAVYAATEDWGAPGEGFDGTAGKSIANRVGREGRELRALVAMATGNPALIAAEHDASKDDDEASWTVTHPSAEQTSVEQSWAADPGGAPAPAQTSEGATGSEFSSGRGFKYGARSADEAAAIEQFPDFVSFEDLLK